MRRRSVLCTLIVEAVEFQRNLDSHHFYQALTKFIKKHAKTEYELPKKGGKDSEDEKDEL